MQALRMVDDWPCDHASVAVVGASGEVLGSHGDDRRVYPLASVTKLLSAYAVLIAVEEGALEWDQPAGPEGSTVRHLIAHTSGLAFDSDQVQSAPGKRRIYSNAGFAALGDSLSKASGMAFADYLTEAVLQPLGMSSTRLTGSPGAGAESTVADLTVFARELQAPRLIAAETLASATSVAFPDLAGVLPGFGRQSPNDWSPENNSDLIYRGCPWGLGFEIRGYKWPHWTGRNSSPRTFGHFGQSGTFLWVDPVAGCACVALTDRDFDQWAKDAWPALTDAVLADLGRT